MIRVLLYYFTLGFLVVGCSGGPAINEYGSDGEDSVGINSFEQTGEFCGLSSQELLLREGVEERDLIIYQGVHEIKVQDCSGKYKHTIKDRDPEVKGLLQLNFDNVGIGRIGIRTVKNHTLCEMQVLEPSFFGLTYDGSISLPVSLSADDDSFTVALGKNKIEYAVYSKACDLDEFEESGCKDLLIESKTLLVNVKQEDAYYSIVKSVRECK